MAGIGFELRRIIDNDKGVLQSIKSYGSAAITINGPMIMSITSVIIVKSIIGSDEYSGISSDKILMTITFAFLISTLLTGGYTLLLTRYVSDCIYEKKFNKIMPSVYGAIIFATVGSIVFTSALVVITGMQIEHAIPVSALYSIISIIYIEMIYLSAIKNYKSIIRAFFLGNAISVMLVFLVNYFEQARSFQYILFSFNLGFAVAAKMLLHQILISYGKGEGGFMEWLSYFKKYPSLAFSGLFYTISFYFVCLYYRFIDNEGFFQGFIVMKPDFDTAFYFAVLGMIPGTVYFAVRFETSLYQCCQKLFSAIGENGTLDEIKIKLQFLVMTIKNCFTKMVLVQGAVLSLILIIPFAFIQVDHTSFIKYSLYFEFAFAFSSTLLMYVLNIVILYFNERRYSLFINSAYLALNIILTIWIDSSVVKIRGFGFMIASFISMVLALILMLRLLKKLKNYIFIMRNS